MNYQALFLYSEKQTNCKTTTGQKFRLTTESFFDCGSSRSLCGHFLSKNMGKLRLDRW